MKAEFHFQIYNAFCYITLPSTDAVETAIVMAKTDTFKYLKYALALFTFSFGVLLLAGVALKDLPEQVRYTFGIVLVLMGIYRFVITRLQTSRSRDLDA